MKYRTSLVLIGILVVVCLGLVLSVVYPFNTSDPHAGNPPDERFTVGTANAYSVTGSILVDREVKLALEGVVTTDGAWFRRVVEEDVILEEYKPAVNGTVYQRFVIERDDHAGQLREEIIEDEDRTLLSENKEGDRVTFIVAKNTSIGTEPVSGAASVFINSLSVAEYKAVGSSSAGVAVYEPQPGWYDARESYRITEVSGEVQANADTNEVYSANVSWDVTIPAGTYAVYVMARLTGDDPTTRRITYEFDPDDSNLDRPRWVNMATSE